MSEFKIIKLFQTFAEIAAIEVVAVAIRRHAVRLIFDVCLHVCMLSSIYVSNLLNGEIVQWRKSNFRGDLDLEYIWVFIAFSINIVLMEPEKPNLPLPSAGEIFL